jgi:hypothetical protein
MALPLNFEVVETDIDFVNSSVKFANRCGVVVRVAWKAMILAVVLGQIVEKQNELISKLNDAPLDSFTDDKLITLAVRIEQLVARNDNLLELASQKIREYGIWNAQLSQIEVQRDTLDSMAESYRAATDSEHQALLVAALETMCA